MSWRQQAYTGTLHNYSRGRRKAILSRWYHYPQDRKTVLHLFQESRGLGRGVSADSCLWCPRERVVPDNAANILAYFSCNDFHENNCVRHAAISIVTPHCRITASGHMTSHALYHTIHVMHSRATNLEIPLPGRGSQSVYGII